MITELAIQIVEDHGWVGFDSSHQRVVRTVKPVEDVHNELIFFDHLPDCSKFRGKVLHLRKELGSGEVVLLRAIERPPQM
jgi:hypothetical protein